MVLYIRGNDVLNSAREVIVGNGQEPLKAAIARLKYQNLDPLTHVSVYVDWPAAGSVDTEIGCFREPEASDEEAKGQSRVQDRGGMLGA